MTTKKDERFLFYKKDDHNQQTNP